MECGELVLNVGQYFHPCQSLIIYYQKGLEWYWMVMLAAIDAVVWKTQDLTIDFSVSHQRKDS